MTPFYFPLLITALACPVPEPEGIPSWDSLQWKDGGQTTIRDYFVTLCPIAAREWRQLINLDTKSKLLSPSSGTKGWWTSNSIEVVKYAFQWDISHNNTKASNSSPEPLLKCIDFCWGPSFNNALHHFRLDLRIQVRTPTTDSTLVNCININW